MTRNEYDKLLDLLYSPDLEVYRLAIKLIENDKVFCEANNIADIAGRVIVPIHNLSIYSQFRELVIHSKDNSDVVLFLTKDKLKFQEE